MEGGCKTLFVTYITNIHVSDSKCSSKTVEERDKRNKGHLFNNTAYITSTTALLHTRTHRSEALGIPGPAVAKGLRSDQDTRGHRGGPESGSPKASSLGGAGGSGHRGAHGAVGSGQDGRTGERAQGSGGSNHVGRADGWVPTGQASRARHASLILHNSKEVGMLHGLAGG